MKVLKYIVANALLITTLGMSGQATPSARIPEATLKAGKQWNIEVHLPRSFATTYQLSAFTTYLLVGAKLDIPSDGRDRFPCSANVNSVVMHGQDSYLVLMCNVPQTLKGGEYRPALPLRVQRTDGSADYREYPELNLPFLTVEELPPPPPPPPTTFPDFDGARLALDVSQSFNDGAVRSFKILTDLSLHFPSGMRDTKQNRAYLLAQAQQAKIIVRLTRARYIKAKQSQGIGNVLPYEPSEVMFDDLTVRLDDVIKGLGGGSFDPQVTAGLVRPHIVLMQAQLPKQVIR